MRMRIVTEKSLAHEVPDIWKAQYFHGGKWGGTIQSHKIYKALIAEKRLTPLKVKNIIGNDSWTSITCDVCYKEHLEKAVCIRENNFDLAMEDNNDGSWQAFYMCKECTDRAYHKFGWPTIAAYRKRSKKP